MQRRIHPLLSWHTYIISGLLTALPMIVDGLAPLAYISIVPVLFFEMKRMEEKKKCSYLLAYARGFQFFFAYGLVTFYWFIELYPLDFLHFTKAQALGVIFLAWLGLSILQAIVSSFLFVLARLLIRGAKMPTWMGLLVFAFLWPLFEYFQTLTWAGVPWGRLAVGQVSVLSMVQSVSLFGPYFIAFLILLVNGALAFFLLNCKNVKGGLALTLALVIFGGNILYGNLRLLFATETEQTVTVGAIQANISSKEKWNGSLSETLKKYYLLTEEAAEKGAKIILWPESAIPSYLKNYPSVCDKITSIAKEYQIDIIFGAFNSSDTKYYNAIFRVDSHGYLDENVYHKRHLVPFGEFVPWRSFLEHIVPDLVHLSPANTDFTQGEDSSIFSLEQGDVGTLICFDSIYESLALDSVRDGAEVLMISTNDSWFGDSSAGYEHEKQAILRAIENGRYVLRAGNTGVSAIITNYGEVTQELGALQSGYVLGELAFIEENTLYTLIGNAILYVCLAGLVFLPAVSLICWRRKHEN